MSPYSSVYFVICLQISEFNLLNRHLFGCPGTLWTELARCSELRIFTYTRTFVHEYSHTLVLMCTNIHIHSYFCARIFTYTRTFVHEYSHKLVLLCTNIHIHSYFCERIFTYTRTFVHEYSHTLVLLCTNIHIHSYFCARILHLQLLRYFQ